MAAGEPTVRRLAGLARTALAAYGVEVGRVSCAGRSYNTVLHVVSTAGRHLSVRIGPEERIHQDRCEEAEAQWLERLADGGAAVNRAVRTVDGHASVTVEVPGVASPRRCMVFEWSPGRTLKDRATGPRLGRAGRLLAQLHEIAAATDGPERPKGVPIGDRIVYFSVADRLWSLRAQYGTLFDDARVRAESTLERIWHEQRTSAHLAHGDFTPANLVVNRSRMTAIDFQDMVWIPEVIDLSITVAALRHATDHAEQTAAFRHGYEDLRRWPELDPDDMEDLIAVRRLSVTNLNIVLSWPHAPATIKRNAEMMREYLRR